MVLSLLLMLAVCSIDSYVDTTALHGQGLKNLVMLYNLGSKFYPEYGVAFEHLTSRTTLEESEYPLVYLQAVSPNNTNFTSELQTFSWSPSLASLRPSEYESIQLQTSDGLQFTLHYSTQAHSIVEARINMCRTTFIIVVLGLASIYFTKDA